MWVDSHCHLGEIGLRSQEEYLAYLERAKLKGVNRFLSVALTHKEYQFLKERKEKGEPIDIAIGIHPFEELCDWTIEEIEKMVQAEDILAIGEIGLDYSRKETKERQRFLFQEQLRIAEKYHKPVVIHSRKAEREMIDCLLHFSGSFMIHAYPGSWESFLRLSSDRSYFSFGSILTSPRADKRREVVQKIPLSYLMLESDAPYGKMAEHLQQENESSFLVETAEKMAELKAISLHSLQRQLYENYQKFQKG